MKAYKVLTENLTSPFDGKTKWAIGGITKISKNEPLEFGAYGLHFYKSLSKITIGDFGSRVFEAEIIGDFIEDNYRLCAYEGTLVKEINPRDITDSQWAYIYCKYIKDDTEVRKNITDSYWAYKYCIYIKDDTEVRKNITDSDWAYAYCRYVNDSPDVRKNITGSGWVY